MKRLNSSDTINRQLIPGLALRFWAWLPSRLYIWVYTDTYLIYPIKFWGANTWYTNNMGPYWQYMELAELRVDTLMLLDNIISWVIGVSSIRFTHAYRTAVDLLTSWLIKGVQGLSWRWMRNLFLSCMVWLIWIIIVMCMLRLRPF